MKRTSFDTQRRQFLVTLAALSAAGATTATWSLGVSAESMGGTLRVSVNRAPGKLNPLLHRLNSEYLLGELLYSGLTRLGTGMEIVPDLAESWTANETLTEWSFRLRTGARFHDGQPVTADDVAASLTAVLDKNTGSPGRRNLGPIESVAAASGDTVRITTSAGYGESAERARLFHREDRASRDRQERSRPAQP